MFNINRLYRPVRCVLDRLLPGAVGVYEMTIVKTRLKKIILTITLAIVFGTTAGFVRDSLANLSCGIPPLLPIGCSQAVCVCDENGNNCRYVFVCD